MFSTAVLSGCSSKPRYQGRYRLQPHRRRETIIQSDTAFETTAQIAEEHLYECTKKVSPFFTTGLILSNGMIHRRNRLYPNPGEILCADIPRHR